MNKLSALAALAAIALSAPASASTFIGDTFEGTYRFPTERRATINSGIGTVDPVAEFTFETGRINPTAQIFARSVLITFAGNGRYNVAEFNGIYLRNLSRRLIAGITLNSNSTAVGFDQSRLSFSSDTLQFNFQGLRLRAGDQISADVNFQGSPVPEPDMWIVMIVGLGGIGCAMRATKKQRRVTLVPN
jgi:hypothetical protein